MNGVREQVLTFFVSVLQRLYPFVPVRRANIAAPEINEQHMVVDIINEHSLGNEVSFDEKEGLTSVAGMIEATLNIQSIGSGACEMLSLLKFYLQDPAMVDQFCCANIAVNDFQDVQDLTMRIDARTWQERASVDLIISYSRELITNSDWFNKVYIEGMVIHGAIGKNKEKDNDIIVDVKVSGELKN